MCMTVVDLQLKYHVEINWPLLATLMTELTSTLQYLHWWQSSLLHYSIYTDDRAHFYITVSTLMTELTSTLQYLHWWQSSLLHYSIYTDDRAHFYITVSTLMTELTSTLMTELTSTVSTLMTVTSTLQYLHWWQSSLLHYSSYTDDRAHFYITVSTLMTELTSTLQ